MLQWFRIHAARVAAVTLALTAVVSGSAVVPHDDDSHDYATLAFEHDPSAHRVEASTDTPETHPLHCVVCHWMRSFRPHAESRVVASASTDAGDRLPHQFVSIAVAAPISQPPLRSPPPARS